ncbi:hypothetical protein [Oceanirhabdus sp. W0125-5]|nr:hypothetical protein [Oceanirhabdus sp. W0125-5]WBW97331.1 hypothetical protein OW730_00320 [Oceanirhabdus sp. W0125-5]
MLSKSGNKPVMVLGMQVNFEMVTGAQTNFGEFIIAKGVKKD